MKRVRLGKPIDIECRIDDADELIAGYEFDRIAFYRSISDISEGIGMNELSDEEKPSNVMTKSGENVAVFQSRSQLDRYLEWLRRNSGHEHGYEWSRNPLRIPRATYGDSGRFFCVFFNRLSDKSLVTSSLVVVHDSTYPYPLLILFLLFT